MSVIQQYTLEGVDILTHSLSRCFDSVFEHIFFSGPG